jgi:type IV pilus assembly protein PilV
LNICKLHSNKGFTVIETMISMAIIVMGIFGVMSLLVSVIKGNTFSKRVTTATTIAEDQMENFRRIGYNNIADDSGTNEDYDIDYYWETDVQDDTPDINTKTVTVDVYWDPAATSSVHSVELNTIIVP